MVCCGGSGGGGGGDSGGGDGDGMVARAVGSCNASITLSSDENPVKDD